MAETTTVLVEQQLGRLRAGDRQARDELFRLVSGRLEVLARKALKRFPGVRRWNDTLDVVQNASLRLWRALDSQAPASSREFFALAATLIRRELIDLLRHFQGPQGMGAHHASNAGKGDLRELPVAAADAEPDRLSGWTELHACVERLETAERELFGLLWYHGMTQEQAAEVLGLSARTVKRQWREVKIKLGGWLHDRFFPREDSHVSDTLLDQLLSRWEALRAARPTASLAEVPTLFPELHEDAGLRAEFRRRVELLEAGERALDLGTAGTVLAPSEPGEAVGPLPAIPGYAVLRELGRGGMGVVYLAEQVGFRRLVALKMLLNSRYASVAERTRFEVEARAIARVQHPQIVQVHEIGEHEGRPFFSMEFCRRGSLAKKLNGIPLFPAEAARLAERLAHGLHAAHQADVVHRDLKPLNILLADDDTPRIADFGLAKHLDSEGAGTPSQAAWGTLQYMAPEQAGGFRNVGVAADVYALGATLYEMLTGRPPFQAATVADLLDQLRSQEPLSPRQLQPKVPRDLETVCLKCLEKDPRKRYPSARELAEDLGRFLERKPVKARPVGRAEQAWRWCRRNPVVAGLAAAVALLLVVTVAVLAVSLASVREERDQADQARALEAVGRQTARQALDEMSSEVIDEWLSQQTTLSAKQKAFLERALSSYERFAQQTGNEPPQRVDVIRAHLRVASIRQLLVQNDDAEHSYRQALALGEDLARCAPLGAGVRNDLADGKVNLGILLKSTRRRPEAERLLRDAADQFHALVAEQPASPEHRFGRVRSLVNLGQLLFDDIRQHEAETVLREALAEQRQLVQLAPGQVGYQAGLARCQRELAVVLIQTNRPGDAQESFRAGVAFLRALPPAARDSVDVRKALGTLLNDLAASLVPSDALSEAREAYREAVHLFSRLVADLPGVPEYRKQLALAQHNLAALLVLAGSPDEAETLYREALAHRRQLALAFPEVAEYRYYQAHSLDSLATFLRQRSQASEAEKLLQQALVLRRQLVEEEPVKSEYRNDLGAALNNLGNLLKDGRQFKMAEAAFREALEVRERLVADVPDRPDFRRGLALTAMNHGVLLAGMNRPGDAEPALLKARALWRQLASAQPDSAEYQASLALTCSNLTSVMVALGRTDDAEAACTDAWVIRQKLADAAPDLPARQNDAAVTLLTLASIRRLLRQDAAGARRLLEQAVPYHQAALRADPKQREYLRYYGGNREVLAFTLADLGEHARAVDVAEELVHLRVAPPEDARKAARVAARCVTLAARDAQLTEALQKERTQSYADRAVAWLRQAVSEGFRDVSRITDEPDFRVLREREDFQSIVKELQARAR